MKTLEALRLALQALWAHKLRSVLTLLGVVIGVAAVIAVVTFVDGINAYVAEKIFNLGADVFIVNKRANVITNFEQFMEGRKRKDILFEDYQAVREACSLCKVVGASSSGERGGRGEVKSGDKSIKDTAIRGWTPSMTRIYDPEVVLGRVFNEHDMETRAPVVIIGQDVLENLLPNADPIGKEVRIEGQSYSVIGVGKKKGKTLGQSQDNYVIMPITSWFKQFGTRTSIRIWGRADEVSQLQDAIDQVRVVLRTRRHDAPGRPDSFEADTNQSLLGIWSDLSQTFFLVAIGLAAISLVVGGVVIMNIMLVSVTERTREVGIRKALGARRSDVLVQFLIESVLLSLAGGILGVLLGVSIAKSVTALIGMPSAIKLWSILAGLAVAGSVGVFFGVYPARRAATLDPIAALRFEL